jgi:hypothetical protein
MAAILCSISLPLCQAQQTTPPLSAPAAKIRATVQALVPGAHLTVIRKDGAEYQGSLVASSSESFSLSEVDERRNVDSRYEDVKKCAEDTVGTTR